MYNSFILRGTEVETYGFHDIVPYLTLEKLYASFNGFIKSIGDLFEVGVTYDYITRNSRGFLCR